jgi:Arc/MetJ family transcription regulator
MLRLVLVRTTIDITDEQRAQLLRLAAERGEKGFSGLVREAIERYLEVQASREALVRQARGMRGTLTKREAEALAARVASVRDDWR